MARPENLTQVVAAEAQPAPVGKATLVVYLSNSLKRSVRVAAAMEGTDASAWVRGLIEERIGK